jgi:hypothetical protein
MHSPAVEGPDSTELARAPYREAHRQAVPTALRSAWHHASTRWTCKRTSIFLKQPHAYSVSPQLASAWRGTRPDQVDTAAGSLQPAASRRIRFKAGCTVSDWQRCTPMHTLSGFPPDCPSACDYLTSVHRVVCCLLAVSLCTCTGSFRSSYSAPPVSRACSQALAGQFLSRRRASSGQGPACSECGWYTTRGAGGTEGSVLDGPSPHSQVLAPHYTGNDYIDYTTLHSSHPHL